MEEYEDEPALDADGLGTGRRLVIAVRQPIPALGFGSQIELAAARHQPRTRRAAV
jgi:hypothetical protein